MFSARILSHSYFHTHLACLACNSVLVYMRSRQNWSSTFIAFNTSYPWIYTYLCIYSYTFMNNSKHPCPLIKLIKSSFSNKSPRNEPMLCVCPILQLLIGNLYPPAYSSAALSRTSQSNIESQTIQFRSGRVQVFKYFIDLLRNFGPYIGEPRPTLGAILNQILILLRIIGNRTLSTRPSVFLS